MTRKSHYTFARLQALANWFRSPVVRCHYCGKVLTRLTATVDHKVPRSHDKRRKCETSNFLPCCKACNTARGNTDYAVFKQADRATMSSAARLFTGRPLAHGHHYSKSLAAASRQRCQSMFHGSHFLPASIWLMIPATIACTSASE